MYIFFYFKIIIIEFNDESVVNVDVVKIWRDNREKFMEIVYRIVK